MRRTLSLLLACLAAAGALLMPGGLRLAPTPVASRSASVCMGGALSKPARVNLRNRAYNKMYKSEMKTAIKKARPTARDAPAACAPWDPAPPRPLPRPPQVLAPGLLLVLDPTE